MRALIRHSRRFVMMLGGEVAQSAFHFGLNIGLARSLSPHDYGRFAILFLVGGLALTYVRALAGVPAGIYISGSAGRRVSRGHDVTFGSAALLISAAIAAGVGLAVWAISDIGALAAALFVGFWTLRSYVRTALLARREVLASGIGDVVFAVSGAGLALAFAGWGGARLDAMMAALAIANALGILASLVALRQPVRVTFGRGMRRRYRALLPGLSWSLVGTTTANIQGQGQSLLVALLAGPAAYAPIAATFVLFSPLRLSASALINMSQPDIAGFLAAGRPDAAKRVALRCMGFLLLAGAVYGGGLLAFLPLIEHRLFSGQFSAEPMTLIAGLAWLIVSVSLLHAPFRVYLETILAFRTLAAVAAISAALGAIVVVGLLLVAAPAWSLFGVLMSEMVVLGACFVLLKPWRAESPARAARERGAYGLTCT